MSTKLKAYLGSTFIARYSLPVDIALAGYDGKFTAYSGIGGYSILTVTTSPNANGSFVTIGTNWVQIQIGAADLAFIQQAPDIAGATDFAFDFFLSIGGVTSKVHGGPLIILPVGSSNSSNYDELTVSLGQATYEIAVDSGFSYAYMSSPDMSLPAEVAARVAGDLYLQEQITGVSTSLTTDISQVNASVATESITRANADSALASQITTVTASVTTLGAQVVTNTAAITTEQTARANGDSANASDITALTATVSGYSSAISANTAAITTEQTARANGDSANASDISTLSATVSGYSSAISANTAAITSEATARAAGDSANASDITTLTATVSGYSGSIASNTAAISSEASTRATADSALASSVTSLTATVNGNTASISAETSARSTGDTTLANSINSLSATVSSQGATISSNTAAISTEATARASGDSANASDISTLYATTSSQGGAISANSAAISSEATARSSGDSANASDISTLSATVSGQASTISSLSSVQATQAGDITTLQASWSVTLDVNGYVTGIYQESTATTSDFTIHTGNFSIVGPTGSAFVPFTVDTVNNIVKMTNVYIDSLVAGSVTTPALANNAAIAIAQGTYGAGMTGDDAYQTAITFNITVPSPCWIFVDAVIIQGFHSGTSWTWKTKLLVNGSAAAGSTVTGTVQNSSLNVKNAQYFSSAGTYAVELDWYGDTHMTLDSAAVFAVGYLNTT